MSFVSDNAVLIAVICALVAVVYGVVLRSWLMKLPAGDEKMQSVAGAVQEGAKAYLNRQYRTIAMVGAVVFVILLVALGLEKDWTYGWHAAVGFLVGAGLSAAAGYIGMMVSVQASTCAPPRPPAAASPRRSRSPSAAARSPACSSSASPCSASPATTGSPATSPPSSASASAAR